MKYAILLRLLRRIADLSSRMGKRQKLFIMIYHRVLDEPDHMRPDEVDKVAFTWQMQLLAQHFNVLPLDDALQRLQSGTLPSRAVCITFDDGYADNYTNALPILQQFNLTATFFIASGFLDGGRMWNDTVIEAVRNAQESVLDLTEIGLGKFNISNETEKSRTASHIILQIKHLPPNERNGCVEYIAIHSQNLPNNLMMTSEQLKELHLSGMNIGGHTVNHPILARLSENEARMEIEENKKALENLLNTRLNIFAYPNGKPGQDYLAAHVDMVRQVGYQAAVATQWGVADQSNNLWQLPRFTPWDRDPVGFMLRMVCWFRM